MHKNLKLSLSLLFSICLCFVVTTSSATITTNAADQSEKAINKANKQQDKVHKRINKIQKRLIKAKEKAGVDVLDDSGFLEGADDRLRWGLIGLAGGLLLTILLSSTFAWIGWLATVAGLGLLVWFLIDP